MAETVYLNDGSMEVILTDKEAFLERLLREKLGDDVARCFTSFAQDLREEVQIQIEEAKDQEHSADDYSAMCHDAMIAFSDILSLLDEPRLNRQKLREAAQNGYDDLYKNL